MNIGFDLHKTIDKFPDMFDIIMKDYIKQGHNVYVISGSEKDSIKKELDDLHVYNYTEILSVIEFLRDIKNILGFYDSNGGWCCDDSIWWPAKAEICTIYNIDMLVDDKKQYREHFGIEHKTKFILLNDNLTSTIRNMNSICKIKGLIFN